MNFLILAIFLDFFLIYFRFLDDKKQLKNGKKGVYFRVGPAWMRRGTQGHVAKPRGLTRTSTWRNVTYRYIILLRVTIHISILNSEFR